MISPPRKPVILVVDDVPDQLATLRCVLQSAGFGVLCAATRDAALRALAEEFVDLLLLDQRLGRATGTKLLAECRSRCPGIGGIVITGYVDLNTALAAIRAGALDLLEKPVNESQVVGAIERCLSASTLAREARYRRWEAEHVMEFPGIIGQSSALATVLSEVRQVAPTDAPVLIQGESGTGKELIAQAIHWLSSRRDGPFKAENAAALPATLLESTLFGVRKGAYTGATADQRGMFEAADRGTFFLDEIGETSHDVQVRLLRVLQEHVITRVGDVEQIPVDVRIIAATNRDLAQAIAEKRFRSDLYFRLAVVTITMPPLRQRAGDIDSLAAHFLEKHASKLGRPVRGFGPGCLEKLHEYGWPGNVRELENVIQRAVILCAGDEITPNLLVLRAVAGTQTSPGNLNLDGTYEQARAGFQRAYFERLYFERAEGNASLAAELAELDRSVIYDYLKRLGIKSSRRDS
jgi:DNA-binding NtrC family response regulator